MNAETLQGVAEGRIDTAVRRWRRPTVRTGGRLRTRIGELSIDLVEQVSEDDITDADAKRAGRATRTEILEGTIAQDGHLYRVRFHLAGDDPRIAVRVTLPTAGEIREIIARLDRLDAASARGPWTRATMVIIAEQPAVRAGDLAELLGFERLWFKQRVRALKELGLTESLEVGYRLSPRGEAVARVLATQT